MNKFKATGDVGACLHEGHPTRTICKWKKKDIKKKNGNVLILNKQIY